MMEGSIALRRFNSLPKSRPETVVALNANHSAIVNGHSIFITKIVNTKDSPRLLVSGHNNRKIGKEVQKGEWAGKPIYTLTLEERATCPSHCSNWGHCYGNAMHMARRHRHGPDLEKRLEFEIAMLARQHKQGFVVRLHVLGDFYSAEYVQLWLDLLYRHSGLHIFGYTARTVEQDGQIASLIARMNERFHDRCFIRTSARTPAPGGASVIFDEKPVPSAIICPAELSKTACCSTCGLCWSPAARDKAILFILHGNPWTGRPRKIIEVTAMNDDDWQELSPWNLKVSDQPRATIRAAMTGKHKAPTVYIGLNAALCKELAWDTGGKKLAKVDVGTGANKGKLRIQQSEKGRFRLAVSGKKGPNNGVRLVMRLPNQPAKTSRPQIIDHRVNGSVVILSIPQEWADVVQVAPYSKTSEPLVGKPIEKMFSKSHPAPSDVATIVVKPDILKMLVDEGAIRPVENAKIKPAETEERGTQKSANGPQLPCVNLVLSGRYLVVGTTPVTLMADEIQITKALYEKFGETLSSKDAALFEKNPAIPVMRIAEKLKGMRIAIEDRKNGWAMANRVAA